MKTTKITTLALIATATVAATISLAATAQADTTPPCTDGQVVVTAGRSEAGASHLGVLLIFSLAPDAARCTLTGYPGVDSGAGGPPLHATRTPYGYIGGLRAGTPPTITLLPSQPAHAVVESDQADPGGGKCPSYSDLQVTPPDTTETVTVEAPMHGCHFQIHQVGSEF